MYCELTKLKGKVKNIINNNNYISMDKGLMPDQIYGLRIKRRLLF